MSDYIKREDAIKTVVDHSPLNPKEAEYMFSGCKSADVVEVVRYKDCARRNIKCGMGEHRWCDFLNMSTKPNDYCSYGERRDDGEYNNSILNARKGEE